MSLARMEIIVEGRIQGVGFRYYTIRHARMLGITGFTRNLPDRSVEVVAEGSRTKLVTLAQALREGPTHAYVQKVSVQWYEWRGEFVDFRVRY